MKSKILTLHGILGKVRSARKKKLRIVTTNGCFDILHIGHLRYLKEAKSLGDILIVGVNSDTSVRKNKDEGRPINNEKVRAEMLSGLSVVDYVFVFSEKDPCMFLDMIKPDIHVKGGDYKGRIIEQDIVEKNSGRVRLLKLIEGYSTTALIDKIIRVYGTSVSGNSKG